MALRTVTLALALTLAGCGQKGPLYFPEAEPAPEPTPADTQDPEASTDSDTEQE